MAQSAFIRKVGIHHETLLNFIMVNPSATLKEISAEFGLTPSWISTVIHSQAFQALLAKRKEQMFEGAVLTLRDKLHGVAEAAVEKLGERVDQSIDPKFLLDVADRTCTVWATRPRV